MAFLPEDKATRLRCYCDTLKNWQWRGYVIVGERAETWLRHECNECRATDVPRLLYDYDLRLTIRGRHLYFETILVCDASDDYTIKVVNIHDV